MVDLELNISHDFVAIRLVGTKDRDLHDTRLSPADLKATHLAGRPPRGRGWSMPHLIETLGGLVLGCIEADFFEVNTSTFFCAFAEIYKISALHRSKVRTQNVCKHW